MLFRRLLYSGQFIAALVLPVWVLIGRGIFGSSVGWDFLLFVVLCPILAAAMLAVAGLTSARRGVRTDRSVSWQDAGVLTAWYVAIIAYGFLDAGWLAAIIVLIALVAFWSAVWQLFSETRTRVKVAFGGFDSVTPPSSGQAPSGGQGGQSGTVIILDPSPPRD